MEGSKDEAVFESMNLNPQLFINTTFNTVDDIVNEAFDFFALEASKTLKIVQGSDNRKSRELSKSIDGVRRMIQSVLEDRLSMWEDYCLRFTFSVPQDFVLPENDESSSSLDLQDGLNNQELDAELESLRDKLNLVGKRSVELTSELEGLERNFVSNEKSARVVNEALKLYDEYEVDDMFKEMTQVASELRTGINRLKTQRVNAVESARLVNHGNELPATISGGNLEELEKFLAELRKM